jgi:hypothetical protein
MPGMIAEDIFIISITIALLVSFFTVLSLLLLVERLRRTETPTALTQSSLESDQTPPTPRSSLDRFFGSEHYQSILDLPTSSYQEEDGKDGQEVCGICLFPVDPGVPVKTIPACKHFFHGL